jgi:hypothetical protein
MPFCKKHPNTQLQIRKGKRNQNFVVCPECKPLETSKPKESTPLAPVTEKHNEPRKPWWDRSLF